MENYFCNRKTDMAYHGLSLIVSLLEDERQGSGAPTIIEELYAYVLEKEGSEQYEDRSVMFYGDNEVGTTLGDSGKKTHRRPTTAEKIHNRTNRLLGELKEIEKYRTLRTLNNSSIGDYVPRKQSGVGGNITQVRYGHNSTGKEKGLFSKILETSPHCGILGSPTQNNNKVTYKTHGDGSTGFYNGVSKIAPLVESLTVKYRI
eukprot:Tbor_TRINITY_DN5592_c1_g1::TRINITY_DN5592_c1_g1_i2::g.13581::m.13581